MIWILLACSGGGAPDTHKNAEPANSLSANDDTGPPPLPDISQTGAKPSLSANEVARSLEAAWSTPPDPGEVVEAYAYLMSMGDEFCPGDPYSITDIWLYGCTAETGFSFAGVSESFYQRIEQQGFEGDLAGVSGDFWIDTNTGSTLEGGGHAVVIKDEKLWAAEMAGSWRWDEGSAPLAHGFSGNILIEFVDDFAITMRGAADISGTHVAAQDYMLSAVCDYGPSGKMSLRDPSGGWYTLNFSNCNPCTDVYFEGELLGETCVDMSGFVNALRGRL